MAEIYPIVILLAMVMFLTSLDCAADCSKVINGAVTSIYCTDSASPQKLFDPGIVSPPQIETPPPALDMARMLEINLQLATQVVQDQQAIINNMRESLAVDEAALFALQERVAVLESIQK